MTPKKSPVAAITLWVILSLVAAAFAAPKARDPPDDAEPALAESMLGPSASKTISSEASPELLANNSSNGAVQQLPTESPSGKKFVVDHTPKASIIMLTLIFTAFVLLLFAVTTWVFGWRFWRCTCREMNCCCCARSSSTEEDIRYSDVSRDDDKAMGKVALIQPPEEEKNERNAEPRVPVYSYLLMSSDT